MATASQAACISDERTPASAKHSLNASTIKPSASRSHLSPNLAQPIPSMATLSLMPLAIAVSRRPHVFAAPRSQRCRLPKIAHEPALFVQRLDAKSHAHFPANDQIVAVQVGKFGYHASTTIELDYAVITRWIDAVG